MDVRFQPIWSFLREYNLSDLKKDLFTSFLLKNNITFFKDPSAISDPELFRFLLLELENVTSEILLNQNLPPKDQLLENFMQLIDYYEPVQNIIKKMQPDILQHPYFLKDLHYFMPKIIKKIFYESHIKNINIPSSLIPFSQKIGCHEFIAVPSFLHEASFTALCLYFLNHFTNDSSSHCENTMAVIDSTLNYIEFNQHV